LRGYTRNTAVGGVGGPIALDTLGIGDAYATLVPSAASGDATMSFIHPTFGLLATSASTLANGEVLYLLIDFDPADVNHDGAVDIFDINLVSAHWGESGPEGDANGDGIVDIFDINLISTNWGAALPGGTRTVPEPGAWTMAVLGMLVGVGGFFRAGHRADARGRRPSECGVAGR
jgi:hypothetical protein